MMMLLRATKLAGRMPQVLKPRIKEGAQGPNELEGPTHDNPACVGPDWVAQCSGVRQGA